MKRHPNRRSIPVRLRDVAGTQPLGIFQSLGQPSVGPWRQVLGDGEVAE